MRPVGLEPTADGLKVRQLSSQHGWTQEEFGKKCDLHRTFIVPSNAASVTSRF